MGRGSNLYESVIYELNDEIKWLYIGTSVSASEMVSLVVCSNLKFTVYVRVWVPVPGGLVSCPAAPPTQAGRRKLLKHALVLQPPKIPLTNKRSEQ